MFLFRRKALKEQVAVKKLEEKVLIPTTTIYIVLIHDDTNPPDFSKADTFLDINTFHLGRSNIPAATGYNSGFRLLDKNKAEEEMRNIKDGLPILVTVEVPISCLKQVRDKPYVSYPAENIAAKNIVSVEVNRKIFSNPSYVPMNIEPPSHSHNDLPGLNRWFGDLYAGKF